jgi:hypothetical protein
MAQVSVRIVPDQNLETIATSLCDHLKESFAKFKSPNELEVRKRIYYVPSLITTKVRRFGLSILLTGGSEISMTRGSKLWKTRFGKNGV